MGLLAIFSQNKKKEDRDKDSPFLPLPENLLRDMISFAEEREISPWFSYLNDKKVLEISPRHVSFSTTLKAHGARVVARVGSMKEKEEAEKGPENFVLSHWENLPFVDHSWDFILLRTSFLKGKTGRLFREVGRVLSPEGVVCLIDLHPFSVMVQGEHLKNPVSEEGLGPGFEHYFKFLKEAGLTIDAVREVFFDGSFRKFFADQKKGLFESLRRTPFLILFLLKKKK